jgi:hypothetical protein
MIFDNIDLIINLIYTVTDPFPVIFKDALETIQLIPNIETTQAINNVETLYPTLSEEKLQATQLRSEFKIAEQEHLMHKAKWRMIGYIAVVGCINVMCQWMGFY